MISQVSSYNDKQLKLFALLGFNIIEVMLGRLEIENGMMESEMQILAVVF